MTKNPQTTSHDVIRLAFYAAAALSILLTACSPEPAPTPEVLLTIVPTTQAAPAVTTTPTPGPSPTPAPTAMPSAVPPTPTPIPPDPVTMALVGEPETLHPLYATSQAAQAVLATLFVGCTGQDETGKPVALGCEAVPAAENGGAKFVGEGDDRHLEVTFRIRQGWRWTDGQPVTTQDALYAWQLVMSPEAQLRDPLTQKVFAMAAPDQRTVVVSFMSAAQARAAAAGTLRGDVPFEYFTQRGDYARYAEQATPLADANFWAVLRWLPAHLLRDVPAAEQLSSPFASRPIGDGAFELSAWNRGSDIALARTARPFPLSSQGNIPGIIFKFVKDEVTAAKMVESGGAQVSQPIAFEAVREAAGMTPTFAITPVVAPLVEQIVMNTARFPFDDVKVRQALRLALNAGEVISDPITGPAAPAMIANPAGMFYAPDSASTTAGADPARARALLVEAGWQCDTSPCVKAVAQDSGDTVTQTLAFTLVTNERVPRNALSQLLQKQLSAAGFGVDLQIVHGLGKDSRLFAPYEQGGILLTRNFDAALYQAPALTHFSGVFDCPSIPSAEAPAPTQGNVFGFCVPELDNLIAAAEGGEDTITAAGRTKALAAAWSAIIDGALFAPLYSPLWALPWREVGGLRASAVVPITWNAWDWTRIPRH